MLTGSMPILVAADVSATADFYVKVLGFTPGWLWGDPPTVGAVAWGMVSVMFSQISELVGKVEGHQHWFDVEDVDTLYASHLERGAMIVSEIEDKPWGRREYTVRDPNGYHLRFAGFIGYVPKGSKGLPDGVVVATRMPTVEEFQEVAGREFYKDGVPAGFLARTWQGVVATSPDGEAIGVVRIMYDSPGWFSIWDVAVHPDWQGQKVGTAMMEAALEIIRQESPGAFVHLFTFKHAFYERLGFGKESVTMRKV